MQRLGIIGLATLIGLLATNASTSTTTSSPFRLDLVPIATTYRSPVFVASPNDGSDRIFVVEQRGVIKIVHGGVPSRHPFLDIRKQVRDRGAEQGLLSVAFHPDYASNATFYVAYTDSKDDVVVASYMASARNPDRADLDSARVLLRVEKHYRDHNGGLVRFGPDGYLYIGLGDGGVSAEPEGNAQRLDTLLGKLLRIDVDHPDDGLPYGIPPDNPFVGVEGARPEIWAYGLRNPWRFSFDRQTGDLFVADVGAGGPEEVNVQSADSAGGQNYGWNVLEGPHCHLPNTGDVCDSAGMTLPVWGYWHEEAGEGCAIVGGHVYRGVAFPELVGAYLVADVCSGTVWTLEHRDGQWTGAMLFRVDTVVSSFAEDLDGELYLIGLRGRVFRLVPGADETPDGALGFSCWLPGPGSSNWECRALSG